MTNPVAMARRTGQVSLIFKDGKAKQIADTKGSLSGIVRIGDSLWVAGDETKSIERLTSTDLALFNDHARYPLTTFFALDENEIDLEGLAFDETAKRLWFIGSHSRKWPKVKAPAPGDVFAVFAPVERPMNRFLLGHVAIGETARGPEPVHGSGRSLPFSATRSGLIDVLDKTTPLAPYMMLPSKDNGFDIEGLAVAAGTIFVGLRGPVLNGWASLLQLCPVEDGEGGLKVAPRSGGGRPYQHHLLKLDGLGVRDLCVQGNDLVILAGPTMALDGPFRVFRWRDGVRADKDHRVERNDLNVLFEMPSGYGEDHAEGITLFTGKDGVVRLLVIYDSPAGSRITGAEYKADLFDIP